MEERIIECISILRNSNNNQDIQDATKFLIQLISEPDAINALFNVYNSSTNQFDRQHAIIYLIKSINHLWGLMDTDTRFSIFNLLKDILIKEEVWFIRNLIIEAIHFISITGEFDEPIFLFITEAAENGSEEYLLISLILSPLIKYFNETIANFLLSIYERSFFLTEEMNQFRLEIKINSLHSLLFFTTKLSQFQFFHERFPFFWESSINILNYCDTDYYLFKRVTNYLIYALRLNLNLNPLILLQKMLTIFTSNTENTQLNYILQILYVIQNICHYYPHEVLSSELFSPLIDLTIQLSSYLYQPDDSLLLSYSDFFESVYSDLCISEEVLQAMWDVITKVTTTEDGRFFACCSLHATIRNFPSFFDDKLIDISQLLCVSLSEGKRLISEAAAQTAASFINLYEKDLESSIEIVFAVLEASKNVTSSLMLFYLTDILKTTKNSEEIFDNAFPFLMEVLTSGSFELKTASLSALSALALGSTVKINVNFKSIFNLLFEMIQSTNESFNELKPPSIETIAKIISSVTIEIFSDEIFTFVTFCVENMNNSDLTFAVSCFTSIEIIIKSHPKEFMNIIAPSIPLLCELAIKDVMPICKTIIIDSIDKKILSNNEKDEEDEFFIDDNFECNSIPAVVITAVSLRILSYIAKNNVDLCNSIGQHIIQCCTIQSKSLQICQIAAAFSIGNLAEGIAMSRNPLFDNFTETMNFILYNLIKNFEYKSKQNTEILIVFFSAASKIVKWHNHESLGPFLKPILDFAMNLLIKITSEPSYDTNARKLAEKINVFLGMISSSAEDEAPHLLSGFLSFYIDKLANHSEHRFRSLASSFFADLMSSSSQALESEFKMNVLSFAANLANEDGDCFAFAILRDIAFKRDEIEFAQNISKEVYQLCMEKLNLPVSRSKKFFLMRDNAVSTLAIFGMNVIKDSLVFDEFLALFLNALPLVLDFTENESVMEFFVWVFNRCKNENYIELFLRVLIVIFSNLPSVMSKLKLSPRLQSSLLNLLKQLISQHPDPNGFVYKVLDGDEDRASILQQYLKADNQDKNQERAA